MKCDELLDVAIIGGGPAGCVAAKVLAGDGWHVALFDANEKGVERVTEHLPPRAIQLLRRMRLESALGKQHLCNGIVAVWGSDCPDERPYLFEPYGAGLRLDRASFDQALRMAALKAGASVSTGMWLRHFRNDGGVWHMSFHTLNAKRPQQVSARFCIDATGRTARIARQCGGTLHRYDRSVGIIQRFAASEYCQTLSSELLVEASANGWWFSIPSLDRDCVCCFFSDDPAEIRRMVHQNSQSIVDERTWTAHRLQGFAAIEPVTAEPASTSRTIPACSHNWLAVGDAALAMDPLSSNGIATAISTGFYGARAASDLLQGRRDAAPAYSMLLDQLFADYLTRLRNLYASESRFGNHAYWGRRQSSLQDKSLAIHARALSSVDFAS